MNRPVTPEDLRAAVGTSNDHTKEMMLYALAQILEQLESNGHPWSDFLYHRARVIDWLYAGGGDPRCKGSDFYVGVTLSMGSEQVREIRERDRSRRG